MEKRCRLGRNLLDTRRWRRKERERRLTRESEDRSSSKEGRERSRRTLSFFLGPQQPKRVRKEAIQDQDLKVEKEVEEGDGRGGKGGKEGKGRRESWCQGSSLEGEKEWRGLREKRAKDCSDF